MTGCARAISHGILPAFDKRTTEKKELVSLLSQ
jgi:hypothetical protein